MQLSELLRPLLGLLIAIGVPLGVLPINSFLYAWLGVNLGFFLLLLLAFAGVSCGAALVLRSIGLGLLGGLLALPLYGFLLFGRYVSFACFSIDYPANCF